MSEKEKEKCYYCGGDGITVSTTGNYDCQWCQGTGLVDNRPSKLLIALQWGVMIGFWGGLTLMLYRCTYS